MLNQQAVKKKILLMYITKVSGHRQATVAIQRSLKTLDPDVDVKSINGFGYTYPRLEKIVNRTYMAVIKRTPKVWDYLYDNPKLVKKSIPVQEILHKASHNKLSQLFSSFYPQTVVCTQAFPCGMVANYKKTHRLKIKLIGVLTDYAPHAFWLQEGVDYYVVPSEEAKQRFAQNGIPEERIKVFGIPIRLKFAERPDKDELAAKLDLRRDLPTILIMGGGQGLGPIKDVVKALLRWDRELQLIVIAGINRKLIRWLERITPRTPKKLLVYEYADNVDELMEMATLIVTKPGGMTTAESLAKGLPMVIVNPIPGQEMHNTEFLTRQGIGVQVGKDDSIVETIKGLLTNPERLASMSRAAYDNARPYAARDIAKLILNEDV